MSMERIAYIGPYLKVERGSNKSPLQREDLHFDHQRLDADDVLRELRGEDGSLSDPYWFFGPNKGIDGLMTGLTIDSQCMAQWAEVPPESIKNDLRVFQDDLLVKKIVVSLKILGYKPSFSWGIVMGIF